MVQRITTTAAWPELHYLDWKETLDGLHRWAQIVGKVRLAQTPWLNHAWHTALYVTTRGLTTSPIPHGGRSFSIDFDFIHHRLLIERDDGAERRLLLTSRSVADFEAELLDTLARMDLPVHIHGTPNEIPDAIPFAEDTEARPYDGEAVNRFWRALLSTHRVLSEFRTGFIGKASPVHFFWGGFDLAVTRFSGRTAPRHPGGIPNLPDDVTREAYSHEVSSVGFWPGGGGVEFPAFYAYAYPTPKGFAETRVKPANASWNTELGEFILPYEAVRGSSSPEETLLSFLQSTYEAAANLAGWDRAALECELGRPGIPRPI
jgi:hypothetical protein